MRTLRIHRPLVVLISFVSYVLDFLVVKTTLALKRSKTVAERTSQISEEPVGD